MFNSSVVNSVCLKRTNEYLEKKKECINEKSRLCTFAITEKKGFYMMCL